MLETETMSHEFFSEKPSSFPTPINFHKLFVLHEEKDMTWDEVSKMAPLLPRGWFELSKLSAQDRIDFTLQYWLSKLNFCINKGIFLEERLVKFFENLEDIGVFITQENSKASFDAHMVYCLKEEVAFFHGSPPASKEMIDYFIKQFETTNFPKDYLGFLEIHDGFSKYVDRGLIKTKEMAKTYLTFQEDIYDEIIFSSDNIPVDPTTLIPFYESEDLHAYRCFYLDWIPEEEIGNVSYSLIQKKEVQWLFKDGIAYPTFISWLLDYLEERCTE